MDRLTEIEKRLEDHYYWDAWGWNIDEDIDYLIEEVKRLRAQVHMTHAALTYVGPLNQYEWAALKALGVSADSPEPYPTKEVQDLIGSVEPDE